MHNKNFIFTYIYLSVIALLSIAGFFYLIFMSDPVSTSPQKAQEKAIAPSLITNSSTYEEVIKHFGDPESSEITDSGLFCARWSDSKTVIVQVCKPI